MAVSIEQSSSLHESRNTHSFTLVSHFYNIFTFHVQVAQPL